MQEVIKENRYLYQGNEIALFLVDAKSSDTLIDPHKRFVLSCFKVDKEEEAEKLTPLSYDYFPSKTSSLKAYERAERFIGRHKDDV